MHVSVSSCGDVLSPATRVAKKRIPLAQGQARSLNNLSNVVGPETAKPVQKTSHASEVPAVPPKHGFVVASPNEEARIRREEANKARLERMKQVREQGQLLTRQRVQEKRELELKKRAIAKERVKGRLQEEQESSLSLLSQMAEEAMEGFGKAHVAAPAATMQAVQMAEEQRMRMLEAQTVMAERQRRALELARRQWQESDEGIRQVSAVAK